MSITQRIQNLWLLARKSNLQIPIFQNDKSTVTPVNSQDTPISNAQIILSNALNLPEITFTKSQKETPKKGLDFYA